MSLSPGILLIFGIGVFGGLLSALVIKRLSIPQVLGYIVMGIIIGESGFRLVTLSDIETLRPFNYFALGIIGFLVGSEIHFSTLKKYGRQLTAILLSEGILAFFLVGISVYFVMFNVTHSFSIALATGIVFGAIASATDPASTINVLWEYRTAGILTTTLIAIVALDDALAMTLYALGTSIAQILSGGDVVVGAMILKTAFELFGSFFLGIAAGLLLEFILRRSSNEDLGNTAAIGVLLISIGVGVMFDMDIILISMSLGITLVNRVPRRSEELIKHIRSLSTPIYVLFFVLVGARLGITSMPFWLWMLVILYVIGRSAGKMAGAWFGAKITGAAEVVRRYSGMGLFAQGGVAIGLSIMASQHLNKINIAENLSLGDVIITGITATTFIVQIIGPPLVKVAARLSGEIGKNITEDDVINRLLVKDVMQTRFSSVKENTPLGEVFTIFQQSNYPFLPVLDESRTIQGMISMDELRDSMLDQSYWDWLLASDIMANAKETVTETQSLKEAFRLMGQIHAEHLPVVSGEQAGKITGILDRRTARHSVQSKLISLQTSHNNIM